MASTTEEPAAVAPGRTPPDPIAAEEENEDASVEVNEFINSFNLGPNSLENLKS